MNWSRYVGCGVVVAENPAPVRLVRFRSLTASLSLAVSAPFRTRKKRTVVPLFKGALTFSDPFAGRVCGVP